MARGKQDVEIRERTRLLVPLEEAHARLQSQLERGRAAPNQSINENDEARRWYDFTSELLRQISSTDELRDEFTGKRIMNVTQNDLSLQVFKGEATHDEVIPFTEIQEVTIRHKDAT